MKWLLWCFCVCRELELPPVSGSAEGQSLHIPAEPELCPRVTPEREPPPLSAWTPHPTPIQNISPPLSPHHRAPVPTWPSQIPDQFYKPFPSTSLARGTRNEKPDFRSVNTGFQPTLITCLQTPRNLSSNVYRTVCTYIRCTRPIVLLETRARSNHSNCRLHGSSWEQNKKRLASRLITCSSTLRKTQRWLLTVSQTLFLLTERDAMKTSPHVWSGDVAVSDCCFYGGFSVCTVVPSVGAFTVFCRFTQRTVTNHSDSSIKQQDPRWWNKLVENVTASYRSVYLNTAPSFQNTTWETAEFIKAFILTVAPFFSWVFASFLKMLRQLYISFHTSYWAAAGDALTSHHTEAGLHAEHHITSVSSEFSFYFLHFILPDLLVFGSCY